MPALLESELESLIDRYTLKTVLFSLAQVCEEKADYVAEGGSHGDPSAHMAREWKGCAAMIRKAERRATEAGY